MVQSRRFLTDSAGRQHEGWAIHEGGDFRMKTHLAKILYGLAVRRRRCRRCCS